jgi:nitrite reductase/ring-hydroxylating ferredoxin subunit
MGLKKYKWHLVADKEADISWSPGEIGEVEVEGKKICIARFNGGWYGFAASCPHAGAPLTDGHVDGSCQVVCPVHQLRFSLKNGRDSNNDGYRLKTYPVERRPEGIFVGIEEGGGLFSFVRR